MNASPIKSPDIANPYAAILERQIEAILPLDVTGIRASPLGFKHLKDDNDWVYREMAGMALALAHGWNTPQFRFYRGQQVWEQMDRLLGRLLDAAPNGKWWSEQPGSGDDNINRFTLLPLLDLYVRVGGNLAPERQRQCLEVFTLATDHQIASYHEKPGRTRGEYPNMDAYFMLIMATSARVLGQADHYRLALEYLGYLETCLLPDGAFRYYKSTNECEIYHQINVMLLVRLLELTQAERVRELLRRTLPYYPNVVEPCGVAEYYTDPYWKHTWSACSPFALDALATLFPEAPEAGVHRHLARVLCAGMTAFNPFFVVWGLAYWRADDGAAPPNPWLRYDAAIRGPRGRFGAFSWGATTGCCLDTIVGAMVAHGPERFSALQAVGAEAVLREGPANAPDSLFHGRRHGTSAYVTAAEYTRRVIVTATDAAVAVDTPLHPGGVGWNELVPDSGWRMRQVWRLNARRLVGWVGVNAMPGKRDPATELRVYARLGGSLRDVTDQAGLFACGDLRLRVVAHNFASCTPTPAYRFYLDREPTSTEVQLSVPADAAPTETYWALLEIFPSDQRPATIEPVHQGTLIGFTQRDDSKEPSLTVFNGGHAPQTCPLEIAFDAVACRTSSQPSPGPQPRGTFDGQVEAGALVTI